MTKNLIQPILKNGNLLIQPITVTATAIILPTKKTA